MVEEIFHTLLVIIGKDYWAMTILISTKTKDKLRTGLKTCDILKDVWNLASLDIEISMSIKKNFIDSMVKIIPDNECKTNVNFLLYN